MKYDISGPLSELCGNTPKRQFAVKIGIHHSRFYGYLNGNKLAGVNLCGKIAARLGVPIEFFLGFTPKKKINNKSFRDEIYLPKHLQCGEAAVLRMLGGDYLDTDASDICIGEGCPTGGKRLGGHGIGGDECHGGGR